MIIKKIYSINDYHSLFLKDIKQKNLYLGVSINNKYFTKKNIEKYIISMLKYTNKNILILIVDKIQSFNNEILNKQSKNAAIKKANKDGNRINNHCNNIIKNLEEKDKKRISIIRWSDIFDKNYSKQIDIIKHEFKNNNDFKEKIINIIKNNLGEITKRLNYTKLEYLSNYILSEIPLMVNGINYNNKEYTVSFYPGDFKEIYDCVFIYSNLKSKLKINKELYFASAFVD